ncbi:trypsin-like serine peptidase [Sphingobacterium anhuiense]|uniref:trypsin-like serine peptidase n=1 Tax=Sphingobacterium anhuiense TaxID=493780 RepID=UPI003C2C231D
MKRIFSIIVMCLLTHSLFSQEVANLEKNPHFLICKLNMKRVKSKFTGTGIIFQDSFLLTNAHNVFDKDSLFISPAFSTDGAPYGEIKLNLIKGENVFIPKEYKDANSNQFDFAIVKLPSGPTLDKLKNKLTCNSIELGDIKDGDTLHIAGYPVYRFFEFKKNNGLIQLANKTTDYKTIRDGSLFVYKMNARGGSSGSPLWTIRDGKVILVGIHRAGKLWNNQGIVFNEHKKKIITDFLK